VLRQWAERANDVTTVVASLRANAVDMAAALASRDAAAVGACLDTYWTQKKRMAAHAEPAEVTAMLAVLRPLVYGASLCGAGGGGFLVGVAREALNGKAPAAIDAALRADPRTRELTFSVHACTVDTAGLTFA
jgi:fucokinase